MLSTVDLVGGLLVALLLTLAAAALRTRRRAAATRARLADAHAELGAERELLQALVENLHDGVLVCDLDGEVTLANDAAAQMHGDPQRSAMHLWASCLRSSGDRPLLDDELPLPRALSDQVLVDLELVLAPPGGRRTAVTVRGRALHDPAGRRTGAVVVMHDVSEVRRSLDLLRAQTRRDQLTGLGNRYAYSAAPPTDAGATTAVLLLDLDDFKHVNDSLGHGAGDLCLQEVARRLQGCLPPQASAYRLGGDEFAILLPRGDRADAAALAQRVLSAVRRVSLLPPDEGGEDHAVTTASVGVAVGAPGTTSRADLLRQADLAMYRAKSLGKGTYAEYSPQLHEAAAARLEAADDLRRAVDERALTLAYQPVVDLSSGALTGVEALVRWHHPRRGDIAPAELIRVAEQTGTIVPLGAWVLESACRQLLAWDAAGGDTALTMAVNVSMRQLERPGLLEGLDTCLALGLCPERLVLELTETALTVDSHAVRASLRALRARGVRIAIDDFGTGYSSLSRLSTSPVDVLKIDRSFVGEIRAAEDHSPLVQATLAMARGLGLRVVAEGVETPAQLAFLRAGGCDHAQGFLLSRPLAADDLLRLVRSVPPWAGLLSLAGAGSR